MDFDPAELDTLSREDLILRARARGVERPEQMTRIELRDEIVRLSEPDLERQRRTRGWLGVARDLLASVVESGLNLPDAAAAIRGDGKSEHDFQGPPPVATVTLAEIYAAQGHYEQSLQMLDEVIAREPEHATARTLRERIAEERDLGPGRRRKVVETKAETIATPQPPAVAPIPVPAPAPVSPPTPISASPSAPVSGPSVSPVPEPPIAVSPAPDPLVPVSLAPDPPIPDSPVPVSLVPDPPVPVSPVEVSSVPVSPVPDPPVSVAPPTLLVLQTANRAFVYWRLPALSDSLRLRAVTVSPHLQGPHVAEQDLPIVCAVGGCWLSRFAPGTEVRAAVGELSSDGFSPVAIARVLDSDAEVAFDPLGLSTDPDFETAARVAAGL